MSPVGSPALFTPIQAERPRAQALLSEVIAPPYDVLSSEERDAFAQRSPHNIVHLTLPAGASDRYRAAGALLQQWRAAGVLERDDDPALYVVQQEYLTPDGRSHLRTGVIGGLSAEGYESGRVRPHERTHRGPKEDRLALGRATRAALEAIFVLARDERDHLRRRLDGVTRHEPTAVADLDGVTIGVWRIGGIQAAEIARAVGDGPLYIADGHHRYETATALRGELPSASRVPALVVPLRDPGLLVRATHRVVHGAAVSVDDLVAEWIRSFDVSETEPEMDPYGMLQGLGAGPAAAVAFPGGRVVVLRALQADPDALEIAVIEREIMQPLVRAAGSGGTVHYTADPGELFDAVTRDAVAGVLLRPTPAERVLAVADAGEVMPPKSTYFHPKVPSGLLILPFDPMPAGVPA